MIPAAILCLSLSPAAFAAEPAKPVGAFAPEVYQARRAALMKKLGGGVAVLYARGEEDRDGFRPDGDFSYLTGIADPGAVLVLAPEERVYKEMLFLKPRDPEAERWVGERPPLGEGLRASTGFAKIRRAGALNKAMLGLLRTAKTLHLINQPGDIDGPAPPERELYNKLSGRVPGVSVKDASELLPGLRAVKEPRELERMRAAIAATLAAHRAAARAIRPGTEENWVEALIALEFKRAGSARPAFGSIVGSGKNSTILHYPGHDRTIAPGAMVVVDIGAEVGGYAADVTRTYPAGGAFTPEQRKIYETVLRAQKAALELVKAGAYFEDLQRKAEEVIAAAGYGDYFIHGLGHFVGLEVHDAGLYGKPLEAGMVLTIEPGIYIPDRQLGVRIEDEVLVTAKGYELLTGELPREPGEVEALMTQPPPPK